MGQGSAVCVLLSVSRHDLRFYVVLCDRRSGPITRGERPEQNRASGGEKKAALIGAGLSRQLDCMVDGAEWPRGGCPRRKRGSLVLAWRDCPVL